MIDIIFTNDSEPTIVNYPWNVDINLQIYVCIYYSNTATCLTFLVSIFSCYVTVLINTEQTEWVRCKMRYNICYLYALLTYIYFFN